MRRSKRSRLADTLASQAAWRQVADTAVANLKAKGMSTTRAQVVAVLEAQMLWAREAMEAGTFEAVWLQGLGTFHPMTKKVAQYTERHGYGPGQKPGTAAPVAPAEPAETASLRAQLVQELGTDLSPNEQAVLLGGGSTKPKPFSE